FVRRSAKDLKKQILHQLLLIPTACVMLLTNVGIFDVDAYQSSQRLANLDAKDKHYSSKNQPSNYNNRNVRKRKEDVAQIARSITVRVISGDRRGSGILIYRRGNNYDVITNAHVVDATKPTAKIMTVDGVVHSARIVKEAKFPNQDLVLLQFTVKPKVTYRIANLGNLQKLRIGQTLYAAGFANDLRLKEHQRWQFLSGKYTLQLTKPLEAGYSLGYSNRVRKGMSGGPVINELGEVVGINGRHPQPLWGNPYVFTNGEPVCEPLLQWMRQLSWAIPITTVYQYLPKLVPKASARGETLRTLGNSQLEQMGRLVLNCQVPRYSLTELLKAELLQDDDVLIDVAVILPHLLSMLMPTSDTDLALVDKDQSHSFLVGLEF
ncbi:MAG: serine protease, partial [Pseudanabaena sp. ELA607]